MTDSTQTETTALTNEFESQVAEDGKEALKNALPGIEADLAQGGKDLGEVADKLGDDVLGLAKDIGSKVFADAKSDLKNFIDKLPEPVSYLLQGMAGSAEAVLDSISTQAYTQLSGEEKQLIDKTQKLCGSALATVEAFFERATK